MPLDPNRMRLAILSGVSPVCASCKHYWIGQDQGRIGCGKDCGGPIAGMDFPLYDGPMTSLDKFCFRCVSRADFVIKSVQASRMVGVCTKHLALIDQLVAENAERVPEIEVLSGKGIVMPVAGRYTPKSLGEEIHQTEQEIAEEESNG